MDLFIILITAGFFLMMVAKIHKMLGTEDTKELEPCDRHIWRYKETGGLYCERCKMEPDV